MHERLYLALRDGGVRPLFRLLYRVRVEAEERVPPRGPAILVANHVSLLDPFALALATRRPIRFFAKRRLWGYPGLAPLLDRLGGIPVEAGRAALDAVRTGEELLRAGAVVGVFPQGEVSRDGKRWQHGAARLALATGAPLVPVRIVGTDDALRRGHVGLPRVRIVVGEPVAVAPARPTIPRERALTERVREAVERLA